MKTKFITGLFAAALIAASSAFAAEKEVTLTGAGQCAKCSLGKTSSCQNAIVVKKDGKEEVYLMAANAVSKAFHEGICSDVKSIKVTGVVKEVDGQKEITPSKIEEVKG